ncbi:MAG: nuclear transport factor 2 family protein [Flavobacteriaceae bacterium]|nr:nuclear transport factor 2 family protein [Flavobacteriaceae bacterium]
MNNRIVDNTDVQNKTKDIVIHHMDSFYDNDIDALMSDYTEESIIMTLEQTFKGLKEIRLFITEFITYFPKGKTILVLDKLSVENDLGYVVWHAHTPNIKISLGSGTFILKNGKILKQTFVGQLDKKALIT